MEFFDMPGDGSVPEGLELVEMYKKEASDSEVSQAAVAAAPTQDQWPQDLSSSFGDYLPGADFGQWPLAVDPAMLTANPTDFIMSVNPSAVFASIPPNMDENQQEQGRVTRSRAKRTHDQDTSLSERAPAPPAAKRRRQKLYCVCQQPYGGKPMVQCDDCHEWFHCECMKVDPDEIENQDTWQCPKCTKDNDDDEAAAMPDSIEKSTGRRSQQHSCLRPSCNNRTRADSYCSDVCAVQHADGDEAGDDMGSRQARVVVERKKERRPKSQKEATMAISPLQQAKNTMRKKVTKSLTAILMNIMNTHGDDMPAEMQGQLAADPLDFAQSVAIRLENDLHARWTKGDDDSMYKSKIRSLMYNLKDKDNSLFQVRVARGDIPMDKLAAMSAKDMANPTLRSMDDSLRQQSIKNITLKSAPGDDTIIKKTHKGDVVMSQPGPDITHQTSSQFSNHLPYAHLSRSRSPSGSPNASQRDASPANLPVSRLATEIAQDDNETDHGAFTVDDNDTKKDKVVQSTFKKLMGSSQPPRNVAQPAHTHPTKDLEQMYGDSANDDVQLDIGDEGNLVERRSGEAAYIWHGRVEMPEVASFHAKAKQIGGPVLNKADWQALLSSQKMFIEGRIPTDKASAYLAGIQAKFASSHRLALLLIEPDTKQSASSERHAQGLLNHLLFKTRFGVVVRDKKKIKDFYLIPVDSLHPIPNFLHDPINSYSSSFLASNDAVDGFIGVLVLPTPPQRP